jgi:hypothetical protein
MPPDLGQLIGQAAFEQARGVLMEICGYTAAEALTSISAAVQRTRTAPEVLVIALRATPSFAVEWFDLCH